MEHERTLEVFGYAPRAVHHARLQRRRCDGRRAAKVAPARAVHHARVRGRATLVAADQYCAPAQPGRAMP